MKGPGVDNDEFTEFTGKTRKASRNNCLGSKLRPSLRTPHQHHSISSHHVHYSIIIHTLAYRSLAYALDRPPYMLQPGEKAPISAMLTEQSP